MESCPACPTCRLLLRRRPREGVMAFECLRCKYTTPGTPAQQRVFQRTLVAAPSAQTDMLARVAFDPTAMRVRRDCERCGRVFMTMYRVGDAENIGYVCECSFGA